MEQPPPLAPLDDRVVRRPPGHGRQQQPAVRERAEARAGGGVDEPVRRPRRIREEVGAVEAVEPRALEEAALLVVLAEAVAVGVEDAQHARRRRERALVPRQRRHQRREGAARGVERRVRIATGLVPHKLELAALEPTEVERGEAVVLHEDRGVDAQAAVQRLLVGHKRPVRRIGARVADAEHVLRVLGREEEVVAVGV